jgi:pimeloyl-ACP methyl ester carboxylesterase
MGRNHPLYRQLCSLFGARFVVLAFDFRGYGDSDPLDPYRRGATLDFSADIIQGAEFLSQRFGIPLQEVVLAGHSFGSVSVLLAGRRIRTRRIVALGAGDPYGLVVSRERTSHQMAKLRKIGWEVPRAEIAALYEPLFAENLFSDCFSGRVALVSGARESGLAEREPHVLVGKSRPERLPVVVPPGRCGGLGARRGRRGASPPARAGRPMTYLRACRICGSSDYRLFTVKDGFHLQRCRRCDLLQVTDNLSSVNLEDYYGQEFFEQTYDWLEKRRGRRKEYAKFHHRMAEIEKHKPDKGAILDVGCSFGFFLDVARDRSWQPAGVEIGEHAARFARSELGLEVHVSQLRDSPLPQGRFDVVTFWNVLEHLDDPVSDFRRVHGLLKEGGLLVFTTGDVDSYLRRLQGLRWRAFIPPVHLANYGERSVHALMERCGFELIEKTVALPREALLKKLRVLDLLKRLRFSDKMMVFARRR